MTSPSIFIFQRSTLGPERKVPCPWLHHGCTALSSKLDPLQWLSFEIRQQGQDIRAARRPVALQVKLHFANEETVALRGWVICSGPHSKLAAEPVSRLPGQKLREAPCSREAGSAALFYPVPEWLTNHPGVFWGWGLYTLKLRQAWANQEELVMLPHSEASKWMFAKAQGTRPWDGAG